MPTTPHERTPLMLTTNAVDRRTVVRVDGEIDVSSVTRFRTELSTALVEGCDELVVDMDGVGFIDSCGLGALVGVHKQARVLRSQLVLWRPTARTVEILRVTGLDRVFTVETAGEEPVPA